MPSHVAPTAALPHVLSFEAASATGGAARPANSTHARAAKMVGDLSGWFAARPAPAARASLARWRTGFATWRRAGWHVPRRRSWACTLEKDALDDATHLQSPEFYQMVDLASASIAIMDVYEGLLKAAIAVVPIETRVHLDQARIRFAQIAAKKPAD